MAARLIHLENLLHRDARVAMTPLVSGRTFKKGLPGQEVRFLKFLAVGAGKTYAELVAQHGDDLGDVIMSSDDDIDLENVGRHVGRTNRVYLSPDGDVLHVSPAEIEVITAPDGSESSRKPAVPAEPNVNAELPLRWTGRKIPRDEAIRKFAFSRTIAVQHVDGLTYDFLYEMARELASTDALMMLGAGVNGREPLVFVRDGLRYRGFLEGRVDGTRYKLLLHLSNLELRKPAEAQP